MAIIFTVTGDGITGQSTEFANVVMRVGVCTGGVDGAVYEFAPGQDPTPVLGFGPLAIADARAARYAPNAQRYCLKVAATTPGTISSVTKSGSGPVITVAGTDIDGAGAGAWCAVKFKGKVSKAGALGVARLDVALDGASFNYSFDISAQSPPTVIGDEDVTGFTWGSGGTLDGLTVKIGASTVTFADPASETDMLAQLETGLAGYGFDLVQGKYLRIRKDTLGSGSSFSVDAASTADGTLGLDNSTHTGGDATISIPGTGLVLTCASGDYELNEIYSFTTTGPRTALADITAAVEAAAADFTIDFGLVVPIQTPLDEVDARAYTDALDAIMIGWEAAADKRFAIHLTGSPLDGADGPLKLAFADHESRHGAIAHRDCWLPSITPQPQGSLRASLVEQLANTCAKHSFSEDPGNGSNEQIEARLQSADGLTLGRNEATAAIKMGTSQGPGFTTCQTKQGKPRFTRGVTRAGNGALGRFVDLGVARATKAIEAVIWIALGRYENKTFPLNPNGTMREADAAALDAAFERELRQKFVPDHFSQVIARIDRTEVISTTRNFTVEYKAQIRGQSEDVTGKLAVVGTLS